MDTRCFNEDEIADVLALDEGDPRKQHLETCAKCRALALVYLEFMQDRSIPAGSDPAGANRRLQSAFIDAQASGSASRDLSKARATARSGPPWERFISWLPLTLRRPALAAAAVVLLASAAYVGIGPRLAGERPGALRGTPSPPEGSASSAWLLPVEADPSGHPLLRWRRVPGADAYEVRLFGADLSDFARLGPLSDTLLVLRPGVLPPEAAPRGTAGWQVVALQGGLEMAVSSPGTVTLR